MTTLRIAWGCHVSPLKPFRAGTGRPSALRRGRRRGRPVVLLVSALVLALLPAASASASVGGFLGSLFGGLTGTTSRAAVPGTAVAQLTQLNQSKNGDQLPKVGTVPSTAVLGVQNPGTVPVVGRASARADDGAYVAYETRMDTRTVDLMISSPALGGAAPVRVLLPRSWSSRPWQRWPSVYLIHGCCDRSDYQGWTYNTDVENFTASTNALIVMPSDGGAGFGTQWWNNGSTTKGSNYDAFISTEIPQLLERGYRASSRKSIAGLSIGAYATMALASLHPGEYGAAASFSGIPQTDNSLIQQVIQGIAEREGKDPLALWGDPVTNASIWAAHNPAGHAANLRHTLLFISSGNGTPGPLDKAGAPGDPLDAAALNDSQLFVAVLQSLNIPVTVDFYGNGTHSWPYWERELHRAWPILLQGIGQRA